MAIKFSLVNTLVVYLVKFVLIPQYKTKDHWNAGHLSNEQQALKMVHVNETQISMLQHMQMLHEKFVAVLFIQILTGAFVLGMLVLMAVCVQRTGGIIDLLRIIVKLIRTVST